MKVLHILIFAVLLFFTCKPAQQDSQFIPAAQVQDYTIEWVLQTRAAEQDEILIPGTTISVKINDCIFDVLDHAEGDYYQLDADEMQSWHIPESALSAVLGGYAGLFRCVYIEAQAKTLHIKQAWNDAESDTQGWIDLQTLVTIPITDLSHP